MGKVTTTGAIAAIAALTLLVPVGASAGNDPPGEFHQLEVGIGQPPTGCTYQQTSNLFFRCFRKPHPNAVASIFYVRWLPTNQLRLADLGTWVIVYGTPGTFIQSFWFRWD